MLEHDPLARVLYVDLSRRSFSIKQRPDLFEAGLGGTGVGIRLLEEECAPGADPFGPTVRRSVTFARKLKLYKKLGFDGVQFHDDDAVPGMDRLIELETGIILDRNGHQVPDGTPVEFTYCYNRGDLYSLTVSLER